jgi:UDP-2,3-diacylglucosamine pyrophosphatase LpxH
MWSHTRIKKALTRTLEVSREITRYPLDASGRYAVFSDHHKGARTRADDFLVCESTYLQALEYYFDRDYSVIVLGDVEELWEEDPAPVLEAYQAVFAKEAEFFRDGRYLRIYGNHDNFWHTAKNVRDHLDQYYPGITPVDGIVFEYSQDGNQLGEIFLVHGNQGVFDIGTISNIARVMVRLFWRTFQKLTGKGRTTPAEDACLRGIHDTLMYNWADEQSKLILIAGHTHRPIWSSMTHLEQLRYELYALQCASPRPADIDAQVTRLQGEIQKRTQEHPPCNDTIKTNPCYFNTGCCSFSDGDITGIEIENGRIRLIKWDLEDLSRELLQETRLADIFRLL